MRLKDWLSENEVRPTELARTFNVSHSTVLRWCDGSRLPRPKMMDRIREATSGEVQPADFYSPTAAAE